jgi:hypothetical protein
MDTSWESNMTGKLLQLLMRQYKSSVSPASFVFYSVTETARKSSPSSLVRLSLGCQIYPHHDISTISSNLLFIVSSSPSVCLSVRPSV